MGEVGGRRVGGWEWREKGWSLRAFPHSIPRHTLPSGLEAEVVLRQGEWRFHSPRVRAPRRPGRRGRRGGSRCGRGTGGRGRAGARGGRRVQRRFGRARASSPDLGGQGGEAAAGGGVHSRASREKKRVGPALLARSPLSPSVDATGYSHSAQPPPARSLSHTLSRTPNGERPSRRRPASPLPVRPGGRELEERECDTRSAVVRAPHALNALPLPTGLRPPPRRPQPGSGAPTICRGHLWRRNTRR